MKLSTVQCGRVHPHRFQMDKCRYTLTVDRALPCSPSIRLVVDCEETFYWNHERTDCSTKVEEQVNDELK